MTISWYALSRRRGEAQQGRRSRQGKGRAAAAQGRQSCKPVTACPVRFQLLTHLHAGIEDAKNFLAALLPRPMALPPSAKTLQASRVCERTGASNVVTDRYNAHVHAATTCTAHTPLQQHMQAQPSAKLGTTRRRWHPVPMCFRCPWGPHLHCFEVCIKPRPANDIHGGSHEEVIDVKGCRGVGLSGVRVGAGCVEMG